MMMRHHRRWTDPSPKAKGCFRPPTQALMTGWGISTPPKGRVGGLGALHFNMYNNFSARSAEENCGSKNVHVDHRLGRGGGPDPHLDIYDGPVIKTCTHLTIFNGLIIKLDCCNLTWLPDSPSPSTVWLRTSGP
jgi:hypothetical protein